MILYAGLLVESILSDVWPPDRLECQGINILIPKFVGLLPFSSEHPHPQPFSTFAKEAKVEKGASF
jgi:hypothetical protein